MYVFKAQQQQHYDFVLIMLSETKTKQEEIEKAWCCCWHAECVD